MISRPSYQSPRLLAEQWAQHQGRTEEFYLNNIEYLFDLANFNQQPEYYTYILRPLWGEEGQKVIDIGCGIGTAALLLAAWGNSVIGYDINGEVIAFAKFRQGQMGINNVRFQTEVPNLAEFQEATLIVAIDTLEHIDNLREFLLELGAKLRSGIRLFHHDVFDHQGTSPMHLDHSAGIKGWLEDAGFSVKGPAWAVKNKARAPKKSGLRRRGS